MDNYKSLIKTVGQDITMSDHYFEIYNYFKKVYKKFVILYKNGKFYEIMERNEVGCTTEISELLLLTTYYRGDCFCCGIQADSLEVKYLQPLISEGYNVILVDEYERNNGLITRGIREVISAGTNINSSSCNHNYILSIYGEKDSVGLSVISISTGDIYIQEIYNTKDDKSLVENEIYRWINMYIPSEILVYSDTDLKLTVNMEIYYLEKKKEYNNVSYQRNFFNKIYNVEADVDILQELNIHRSPLVLRSLMYGFEYIYVHNEKLLYKMKYPRDSEDNNNLILDYNTIVQLNLLSDNNLDNTSVYNSVFSVINKAKTAMGRRLIKDRLVNPVKNVEELNKRYNLVEKFKNISVNLRGIIDIDKKVRRLFQGLLSVQELVNLVECMDQIVKISGIPEELIPETNIKDFMEDISDKIKDGKFREGFSKDLDNLGLENKKIRERFNKIMEEMNKVIYIANHKKQVKVRLENTAFGYFITTTLKKGAILKKKYPEYTFRASNVGYRITSEEISELSDKLLLNESKYSVLFEKEFVEYQRYLGSKYSKHLEDISYLVAQIDLYSVQAELSIKNVYCRPEIVEGNRSCIIAKDLRHILIERLLKEELYVPNDVEIGTDKVKGLLLYGVNASGKTSYVKAIGISIILAQAGFYVPAREYRYVPFGRLQTRISGNDNLFRGESSFSVEINEIKNILMRSDCNSLVLGDEICRGTTNADAEALVLSVINYLEQNNDTNFIFASHIHKIARDSSLKNTTISKHMRVDFIKDPKNPKEKLIVYNRKLEDTEGEEFYGIEVAEAFNLPKKVIKLAEWRRKEITNKGKEIVSRKKSRYNSNIFMDKCELCSDTRNLETHHLSPQKDANENGIIDYHSKNNEGNLSVLCKSCHSEITRKKVNITKKKRTSKGIKLI